MRLVTAIFVTTSLFGVVFVYPGCGTGVGTSAPTGPLQPPSDPGETNEPTQEIPEEFVPDSDEDGISDGSDQCPETRSGEGVNSLGCAASQRDTDRDGFSDADEVSVIPGTDPFDPTDNPNNVRDTDGDGCSDYDEATLEGLCDNDPNSPAPDEDADGVPDDSDNCITVANPDQADADENGVGDACELFFDFDGDGVEDSVDNCIIFTNPSQADSDGDGIGDACDIVVPPPIAIETVIIADDGQFLGVISDNSFDPDSIASRFGTYGNPFSPLSIWNEFGTYGSNFSLLSPWDDFTITPPAIFEGDLFVAYLTTNRVVAPRIDPNDLAILVGRPEETRP